MVLREKGFDDPRPDQHDGNTRYQGDDIPGYFPKSHTKGNAPPPTDQGTGQEHGLGGARPGPLENTLVRV